MKKSLMKQKQWQLSVKIVWFVGPIGFYRTGQHHEMNNMCPGSALCNMSRVRSQAVFTVVVSDERGRSVVFVGPFASLFFILIFFYVAILHKNLILYAGSTLTTDFQLLSNYWIFLVWLNPMWIFFIFAGCIMARQFSLPLTFSICF